MRDVTVVDAAKITTGAVPAAALTNVDLVEGTKGTDIVSAGTMVIGTDGGYFDITGTTGISTMTVAAGRVFTLQFDAVVTLTHSSTLYLSGAADFTTEANDHMTFISVAANDVRQIGTGLKDGGSPVAAAAGGGWEFVSLITASAIEDIDFTNMVSGYDYQYITRDMIPGTNDGVNYIGELGVAGPTFRGSSGYLTSFTCITNSGTSFSEEPTNNIRMVHPGVLALGDQTNEALYRYILELSDPATAGTKTSFYGYGTIYSNSPEMVAITVAGVYTTAEAHTSMRFTPNNGNLTGKVYQYRRSLS